MRLAAAGIFAEMVFASTATPWSVIPLRLGKCRGKELHTDSDSHEHRRRHEHHEHKHAQAQKKGFVNRRFQMCMLKFPNRLCPARQCNFMSTPPPSHSHREGPEVERFQTNFFYHHPDGSHLRRPTLSIRRRSKIQAANSSGCLSTHRAVAEFISLHDKRGQ